MGGRTPLEADANYERLGGDTKVIPEGLYCYAWTGSADPELGLIRHVAPCPYWGHGPEKGNQQNGYCAHLKAGDWEDGGTMFLWDMVKECGINDNIPEEDEAA